MGNVGAYCEKLAIQREKEERKASLPLLFLAFHPLT